MAVELNNTTANHWSETDGSNTATPPDGAPAGMFPNQSEPVWRGIMATVKRFWDRSNGALTIGGTANAITLTPANTAYPTAYIIGEIYQFKASADNTAATTLNINSLGTKPIFKRGTSGVTALVGGEIHAGDNVMVSYDGTHFQIISDLPVGAVSGFLTQANNLSDLASLATALTNLGFVTSAGTNGYVKLPGGIIIQWLTTASIGSGSSSVITLPLTFPNSFYGVGATRNSFDGSGTGSSGNGSVPIDNSTFTQYNNNGSAAAFFCIAIGK